MLLDDGEKIAAVKAEIEDLESIHLQEFLNLCDEREVEPGDVLKAISRPSAL